MMFIFGLAGMAFCGFKIYDAWHGGGNIPFGAIFGGAIGGVGGAMVGGVLDGEKKLKPKVNWSGLIFWSVVSIPWIFIFISGFTG